jgi:hypothetical protein
MSKSQDSADSVGDESREATKKEKEKLLKESRQTSKEQKGK